MKADNVVAYQFPVYDYQDLPHELLAEVRKREQRAINPPLFRAFNPVPSELLDMQKGIETLYIDFCGMKK